MKNDKINILFYLDKRKVNNKGKCPLRGRITYLGARKQFASGLFINPLFWNSKQQLAEPPETTILFKD